MPCDRRNRSSLDLRPGYGHQPRTDRCDAPWIEQRDVLRGGVVPTIAYSWLPPRCYRADLLFEPRQISLPALKAFNKVLKVCWTQSM